MIKHSVQGLIEGAGGPMRDIPVEIEFCYDPEDPLAVEMTFEYEDEVFGPLVVIWAVSRELLAQGVTSTIPQGRGDIQLHLASRDSARIFLSSPDGQARIQLPRQELVRFLNATQDIVRLGEECMDEVIDGAIEEILNS